MKTILVCLLLGLGPGLCSAAPIRGDIKIDNFGYRLTDQKTAYFTVNPGTRVEIRDAATGLLVYATKNITFKGKDTGTPRISGDSVWWVDFSNFMTAGRYYLYSAALQEQSYSFQVNDSVYQAPMTATLKALYYQRCGTPKPALYAGAPWSDSSPCHTGDRACGPVSGCVFPQDYGTLDLSGGWHDAGDYNKYIGSAPCKGWGGDPGHTLHSLLTAYEWNPGLFPDRQTHIPESGNGISDLLDECKWELDWYLKMQRTDHHVLSVLKGHDSTSPPSADTTVRHYAPPNEQSEAQFVAVLSQAARVMNGVPALAGYAVTLKTAAEATWNSFVRSATAGDTKFWAAAEIFRMEQAMAGPASIITAAQSIVDGYKNWNGLSLVESRWTTFQIKYGILAYVQATGATPRVVVGMKADWGKMVNELFALNDLYNSGMRGVDYYWGSNDVKMAYGIELVWAAKLGATGAYSGTQCLRHAEDFLHYMDGANPLNMTYMTNSAVLGASHGIWRIYHQWFGNYDVPFSYHRFMGKPSSVVDPLYPYFAGTDNFGVSDSGPSTYGPPPGIVTDGPSREYYSFGLKAIPPLLAGGAEPPYEKAYRDWNYVGPRRSKTQPWVVNETGIYYISSYTALASAFVDQFEKKEARGRQ